MKNGMMVALTFLAIAASAAAEDSPVSLNVWDDIQIPGNSGSSITGIRFNLLYGVNQNLTGIDFLLTPFAINILHGNLSGAQFGLYNQVDGSALGFQGGFVNNASKITGVQFGFVNLANKLKGVQIGLVNIHKGGAGFPDSPMFFPFVNWAF